MAFYRNLHFLGPILLKDFTFTGNLAPFAGARLWARLQRVLPRSLGWDTRTRVRWVPRTRECSAFLSV